MGWLSELDDKRGAGAIFTVIAAGVAVVAGVVQLDQRADLGPQLAVQSEAEHAVAVAPAGADGLDVADAGAQAEIAARRHAPAPAGVERVLAGPVVQSDLAGAEQDAVDAAVGLGRAAAAGVAEREGAFRAGIDGAQVPLLLQIILMAEISDGAGIRSQQFGQLQKSVDGLDAQAGVGDAAGP